MEMKWVKLESTKLAYEIWGQGAVEIVIEMGLGTSRGEWQQIAKQIASKHTVLLYERAGYGQSEVSTLERTPKNVVKELYELLNKCPHAEQIVLLAHSQGGLYAQQFTRLYLQLVKGLILLDPLSASDNDFKVRLTPKEYKGGGVNKTGGLKLGRLMAKLHLGGLLKKMMHSAPPFYYVNNFTKEEENSILNALTKPSFYDTAIKEYDLAHMENHIDDLKEKGNFPDVPLVLITHDSGIEVKEIMQFGGLDEVGAKKVEDIWQDIMKRYLTFSPKAKWLVAQNSSHYIHLTDTALVLQALKELLE